MISKLKPAITPVATALIKPISFVHPNVLTALGALPPIVFLLAMREQAYGWALAGLVLSIVDTLDGALARYSGKGSAFGALLDSSIDRVSDALYLTGFAFAGLISWELGIATLVATFMISYLRTRAEAAGDNKFILNVGLMQRPERTVALVTAVLLAMFDQNQWVTYVFYALCILSWFTVLQRYYFSYKLLKDI